MFSCKKPPVKTYRDLIVYQKSYELAMEVFKITAEFPKEERYSLTDQMRRSSRSIPANLAEGWSKRKYENVFKRHMVDATGSCDEMKVWLNFALDCNYITNEIHAHYDSEYREVGLMMSSLLKNWKTF